jgi:hypothetical protein
VKETIIGEVNNNQFLAMLSSGCEQDNEYRGKSIGSELFLFSLSPVNNRNKGGGFRKGVGKFSATRTG